MVNFKNTVIIITSNAGSQLIHDYQQRRDAQSASGTFGLGTAHGSSGRALRVPTQSMKSPAEEREMQKKVEDELHSHFRPEFLNRIDDIIIFHALELEHIKRIVDIQLRRLAREGYDPAFGARPLKRAIQKLVVDPLAIRLLEGKFKAGDTVLVSLASGGGGLDLSVEPSG